MTIRGFRTFRRVAKSPTASGHDDDRHSARVRHGRRVCLVHEVRTSRLTPPYISIDICSSVRRRK